MNKGFTLIELLIVIAIIGILASAVVVSLSDATGSAEDARNKLSVAQLRPIALLYRESNGNYTDICTAGDSFGDVKTSIETENYVCNSNEKNWVIVFRLKGTTGAYCFDSVGKSVKVSISDSSSSTLVYHVSGQLTYTSSSIACPTS